MPVRSLIERLRDAFRRTHDLASYSDALMDPPHAEPRLATTDVNGSLFRLHSKEHIYIDEFWKTFLDGD